MVKVKRRMQVIQLFVFDFISYWRRQETAAGEGHSWLVVQQQSEDELVRSVGLHLRAARSGLLGSAI